MSQNRESCLDTIIKQHYSNIYELNIADETITEYSIDLMESLETLSYKEWLHQIVSQMQFIQISPFTEQTQLDRLFLELRENPVYIISYQIKKEDSVRSYQLEFCYSDDKKHTILLTKQDVTKYAAKYNDRQLELEKDSARFRFIISHLCEDFGDINIETGKTWMTTCNNWEVSQGNLKDQIDWFADNLIIPEQRERYREDFKLENFVSSLRRNDGYYAPTYEANYPDGRRHLQIINGLLSNPDNPKEEYIFGFVQDITQLKAQEEKNKHLLDISQELLTLSQTDSLTKLYNRIAGEKQIRDYLQVKSKYELAALLIVDIDYFKKFDDQYGHPVGDTVLKCLAASMQHTFRSSDILCRWGGDEFVIFMPDAVNKAMVEESIETLQRNMSRHFHNHTPLPISLSIGGILVKKPMPLELLYEKADKYLYQVKSSGRNNYCISVKDMFL